MIDLLRVKSDASHLDTSLDGSHFIAYISCEAIRRIKMTRYPGPRHSWIEALQGWSSAGLEEDWDDRRERGGYLKGRLSPPLPLTLHVSPNSHVHRPPHRSLGRLSRRECFRSRRRLQLG